MARPRLIATLALLVLAGGSASPHVTTAAEPPAPAAGATAAAESAADREAAYTRSIARRADGVVKAAEIPDAAKASRVREAVIAQYRALRDWHDTNGGALREIGNRPEGRGRVAEIKATLKPLHDAFLAKLAEDLSPEQVERVKDAMTYNVVRVTYAAFCSMLPQLSEAQKAKILQTLKEAREEAMDGGTSEEKHAIFGRYKGRINNYLSAEGYDLKKASKEWADRERQRKAEAAAGPRKAQ